jgi:hypothetical protein
MEEERSEVRRPAPEKNGIAASSDKGASDRPGRNAVLIPCAVIGGHRPAWPTRAQRMAA